MSIVILKDFDVKTITYDTGLEFAKHGFLMICWGTRVTSANPRTDGRWVAWKTTADWCGNIFRKDLTSAESHWSGFKRSKIRPTTDRKISETIKRPVTSLTNLKSHE